MATSKVRYVGHIVAAVVADTRAAAEDAAEAIEVDYDLLPAVMDVDAARDPDAPILHESWPDNVLAIDQQSQVMVVRHFNQPARSWTSNSKSVEHSAAL